MKKLFFVLTTAVLFFLTACNGYFVDPGMLDSIGGGGSFNGGGDHGGGDHGGGGYGGGGYGDGDYDDGDYGGGGSGTQKPAAPTGVKATAESSSSIKISWNPVSDSDAFYYYVYRSTSSSGTYDLVGYVLFYSTSYTDTGLSSNTTYYYKVSAENTAGKESDKSSSVYAKTLSETSGGSGGVAATYTVNWNDYRSSGFGATLEITYVENLKTDQRQKIADAIKLTDIEMNPADVITLDEVASQTTRDFFRVKCSVLKSGTVKITLKPIAGFTFTKSNSGTDTITVTK